MVRRNIFDLINSEVKNLNKYIALQTNRPKRSALDTLIYNFIKNISVCNDTEEEGIHI